MSESIERKESQEDRLVGITIINKDLKNIGGSFSPKALWVPPPMQVLVLGAHYKCYRNALLGLVCIQVLQKCIIDELGLMASPSSREPQ